MSPPPMPVLCYLTACSGMGATECQHSYHDSRSSTTVRCIVCVRVNISVSNNVQCICRGVFRGAGEANRRPSPLLNSANIGLHARSPMFETSQRESFCDAWKAPKSVYGRVLLRTPLGDMGAHRHGQEGAFAPLWKCCKVFCALVVTAKRSVDELFMHYIHNLSSASGGFAPRPPGAPFLGSAG